MELVRGEDVVVTSNVWVSYSGADKPALRGVTVSLGLGKLVLVTGPNGAGKTTLLETFLGLLRPFYGEARLFGIDTRSRRILRARRLCSYVPQDFMRPPYDSYTVRQVVAMGLASHKTVLEPLTGEEEARITSVAEALGIEKLMDKPVGHLSSGQQQRVFIARALVRKPRALFLDEPFSSLDQDSRRLVADLLREYVDETRALAVVVSHDFTYIHGLADKVLVVEDGRITRVEAC